MSAKIGALQGRRWGPGFMPTVAFALLVGITVAAIATSVGTDRGAERSGTQEAPATSVVSGTAANTPTEIRGGMAEAPATSVVAGTAANTPTEMTGGIGFPTVWPRTADATAAAFEAAERYERHQRI